MSEQRTFTLDEIEQRTGFDKRTIAYYVQQGLLPKVGRRGPKTRYPQLFMDRLQFVNMIRKKQDLGEIGSLTLSDIRDILERVSAETIAGVVAGEEPLKVVNHLGGVEPMVPVVPINNPRPMVVQSNPMSSALAAEAAEISEALMDPSERPRTGARSQPESAARPHGCQLGLLPRSRHRVRVKRPSDSGSRQRLHPPRPSIRRRGQEQSGDANQKWNTGGQRTGGH